jgi:hypothetical protein
MAIIRSRPPHTCNTMTRSPGSTLAWATYHTLWRHIPVVLGNPQATAAEIPILGWTTRPVQLGAFNRRDTKVTRTAFPRTAYDSRSLIKANWQRLGGGLQTRASVVGHRDLHPTSARLGSSRHTTTSARLIEIVLVCSQEEQRH